MRLAGWLIGWLTTSNHSLTLPWSPVTATAQSPNDGVGLAIVVATTTASAWGEQYIVVDQIYLLVGRWASGRCRAKMEVGLVRSRRRRPPPTTTSASNNNNWEKESVDGAKRVLARRTPTSNVYSVPIMRLQERLATKVIHPLSVDVPVCGMMGLVVRSFVRRVSCPSCTSNNKHGVAS